MSMHQMEDFIEAAVRAVAGTNLPRQQKRNLIHTLFEMESCADCSFTNLRTIHEMLACGYSFAFEKDEIADTAKFEDAGAYYDSGTKRYFVDSGSEAWLALVNSGKLAGDAATPVAVLPYTEALKQVIPHLALDNSLKQGLAMTAMMTGIYEDLTNEDCLSIFGVTLQQLENAAEGKPEPPFEAATSGTDGYKICEEPVDFKYISSIVAGEKLIIKGYQTACKIALWDKTVSFHLEILLPTPTEVAIGSWEQYGLIGTEEEIIESLEKTTPINKIDQFVDIVNQYIIDMNHIPHYFSNILQLAGHGGAEAACKIDKLTCIIQILTLGTKIDYFYQITIPKKESFALHSCEVVEIIKNKLEENQ